MLKLKYICTKIGIECSNDIDIKSLNTLQDASCNEISFLENSKYLSILKNTKAGAVFVTPDIVSEVPSNTIALVCEHPYEALAKASKFFAKLAIEPKGNKPQIAENCNIMNNTHIGFDTTIGKNCTIMSGVFIGDNVIIGSNCIIYPSVTIYRDCIVGNDCIIHANTVIGSDGFGFAPTKDGKYIKIYQNGNVVIGNDVEIGSNTSIDRAVFSSTIIEDSVKIDNLVQIAHNCKIGYSSIITSQCGFAGSSVLNEYVIVGAQSGIAGHLEIAPHTIISAKSGVTKSIKEPKKQWAGFPLMEHRRWLRLQGKIASLLRKDK
ncbi:UDP-3-O-[3-hydroxymyristoyl] glucosamine N-acyltransferase [hydrothermal vent metagenome]|uniref:UDP-3-O-[3-hydroxymyristoyl] glucosamine N-acyltransferase n=1 Tax=hydrothermal vent metagenome TaxID=652676 RepID=A0A3B1E9H9_9ZZZZ